jgi:N-acetylneuraminic acid mutarotase
MRFKFQLSVALSLALLIICCKKDNEPIPGPSAATEQWERMADAGGKRDFGFTFTINGKGYIGGGQPSQKDFWEYDPATNVWTQKKDFQGEARVYATTFSIGSKGYVTIGLGNGTALKDLWEYDPATDNWIQKNDLPFDGTFDAIGFSIGTKGYVGAGILFASTLSSNFWEYNPTTDSWTKKADIPGDPRAFSFGFAIGSKGYVGGGITRPGNITLKTFYEYDVSNDQWNLKTNLPEDADCSYNTNSFALGSKGYVSAANGSQLWQFDPTSNAWLRKLDPPTQVYGVCFSIGDYGYLGASYDKNFYRYSP